MTNSEITTERPTIQNPPAWEVLAAARNFAAAPAVVIPTTVVVRLDQAEAGAAAQRAGDVAYAWAQAHGRGGEQASVDYHLEFQTVARELGCGPVCDCLLCAEQFGGEGAQ